MLQFFFSQPDLAVYFLDYLLEYALRVQFYLTLPLRLYILYEMLLY
jgi:hypothetical protein